MPSQQSSLRGIRTASVCQPAIAAMLAASLGPSNIAFPLTHMYSVPDRETPSSRIVAPAALTRWLPWMRTLTGPVAAPAELGSSAAMTAQATSPARSGVVAQRRRRRTARILIPPFPTLPAARLTGRSSPAGRSRVPPMIARKCRSRPLDSGRGLGQGTRLRGGPELGGELLGGLVLGLGARLLHLFLGRTAVLLAGHGCLLRLGRPGGGWGRSPPVEYHSEARAVASRPR